MLTVAIARHNLVLRGLLKLILLDQSSARLAVLYNEPRRGWLRSNDLLQGGGVWVDKPRREIGRCGAGDESEGSDDAKDDCHLDLKSC